MSVTDRLCVSQMSVTLNKLVGGWGAEGRVALPLRSKSEVNEGIGVRMGAKCVLKARSVSGSEACTITGTLPIVYVFVSV